MRDFSHASGLDAAAAATRGPALTEPNWKQSTVPQLAAQLLGAFDDWLQGAAPQGNAPSLLLEIVRRLPGAAVQKAAAGWMPSSVELDAVDPLVACLAAWGYTLGRDLVAALAAWCEVEGSARPLTPLTPCLFTVEVLLTALRVPFHSVADAAAEDLLPLSPSGILLWESSTGQVRFVEDVADAPVGSCAVIRVPTLERLGEDEVRLFLDLGCEVMLCYQADLDKRRRWVRHRPGETVRDRFVEGVRTWHFRGNVFGSVCTAAEAPGTPVEIWKDHRGSLHFRRPGEVGEPSMTRTALVLDLPVGLPARLDEPAPEALLRCPSVVFPEAARLDAMHRALDVVRACPPMLRPLDDTRSVELRQRMDDRLRGGPQGDDALEVFAPLHDALDLPGLRDFAAMALIYEQYAWKETSPRTIATSQKLTMLRSTLRNHLFDLIGNPDAQVRSAACALLATSPCMATPAERAVVEYELELRLDDADPRVAAQAAVALASSALQDERPLAPLFRPRPRAVTDSQSQGARRTRLQALAVQIATVQKRLSGAQSKDVSPTAGLLAELLHDAREAMVRSPLTQGRIVLMPPTLVDACMKRVREHTEAYAAERGWSPDDVLDHFDRRGAAEWFSYVARTEMALAQQGVDEDEERDVESFSCCRTCAPVPFWIEAEGHISPLLTGLLRRFAEGGLGSVHLARLPLGAKVVTRLPAVLHLQIFDPRQARFVPMVEEVLTRAQGFDHDLWTRLADVMRGAGNAAVPSTLAPDTAKPSSDARPRPLAVPLDADQVSAEVARRAQGLLRAFGLPETALLPAVYALHDTDLAPRPVPSQIPAPQPDVKNDPEVALLVV